MAHTFQATRSSAARVSADETRLPGPRNGVGSVKFGFAHPPQRWYYHAGKLYPRVVRIDLQPGVNACKTADKGGHFSMKQELIEEGWVWIDDAVEVVYHDADGELVEDTGYLLKYDGERGPIYADCWANPQVYGQGRHRTVDWETHRDIDGFRLWTLRLVESGVIPPIRADVLARLIRVQERRAHRRERHAPGNPAVQAHVEAEVKKLAGLRAVQADASSRKQTTKRGPNRVGRTKASADAA